MTDQSKLYRRAESKLQDIAASIRRRLGPHIHFALLIYADKPEGQTGYGGYVSSGTRESMIAAMKETIQTLEMGSDVEPGRPVPGLDTKAN